MPGCPTLLGIGAGDVVAIPSVCYPTYEVGARLVGATVVRTDDPPSLGNTPVKLLWINSPGNPNGRVLAPEELRSTVAWARDNGVVVASDECYLTLGWEEQPTSILSVCGDDMTGVLAVHSLSKRSNLAGYRAGFIAGDSGSRRRPARRTETHRNDRAGTRTGGDGRGVDG